MNSPRFAVGDLVVVAPLHQRPADRGVVYRVQNILKVNIDVVDARGGSRRMRAHPDLFLPAPADAVAALGDTGAEVVPLLPMLWQATVVTISGPGWKQPADQLWVVLKDKGDTVSVAKLGGIDKGTYYPRVPRSYVTAVDPAHLTYTPPQPGPAAA